MTSSFENSTNGPSPAKRQPASIRSVDKVVDILELLSRERRGLPLGDIATRLELNVSTVHHLLATLKQRGLIAQDERARSYRLGYGLVAIVNDFLADTDLYSAAIGPVEVLRDCSGETSYLSAFQGQSITQVILLPGVRPIQVRRVQRPGQFMLHSTATGKTLLAYLPTAESAALLAERALPPFTPNTITDPARLNREVAVIRSRGYALDDEEDYVGVQCVAAPVFGSGGACVAAASVSYPTSPGPRTDELIRLVTDAAATISGNLGAVPVNRRAGSADGRAASLQDAVSR